MRLSDTSYRRYQKFPGFIAGTLGRVNQIAAQTTDDAQRAVALGADAKHVQVVGNLKFDVPVPSSAEAAHLAQLKSRIVPQRGAWLAGSTHQGEDPIVLNVHAEILQSNPSHLLILVPRHPERFDDVYRLSRARFVTQKRSELSDGEELKADTQVLLLDSMGELNQFISLSDWVFIGGSLVPIGGHNILEACQAGVPVLFGQFMLNFRQVAQIVVEKNAGIQVLDEAGLLQASKQLLQDANARTEMGRNGLAVIQANKGATDRTLKLLSPWL